MFTAIHHSNIFSHCVNLNSKAPLHCVFPFKHLYIVFSQRYALLSTNPWFTHFLGHFFVALFQFLKFGTLFVGHFLGHFFTFFVALFRGTFCDLLVSYINIFDNLAFWKYGTWVFSALYLAVPDCTRLYLALPWSVLVCHGTLFCMKASGGLYIQV